MFVCCKCGSVFAEPKQILDDPSPSGVSLGSGAYRYYHCPVCGSEDIEQGERCKACGEWHITGNTLCGACADDFADGLERLRRGMGLTEDDFEQSIVDHYKW